MSNATPVIDFSDDLAAFLARTNQFGEKNKLLIQPKKNKSPGDGSASPGFPASSSTSKSVAQWPNMVDDFLLKFFGWTGGTETMGASGVALKFLSGMEVAGAKILASTGTPEGAVTAGVGSIYMDTAGSSGTTLYTKSTGTGNTGWEVVGGGGTTINTISTATAGFGTAQINITFDTGQDLADQTINGYDLRSTQVETYYVVDGKRGLYSRQATRVDENAGPGNSPLLQITENLTIHALLYLYESRMNGTPLYPGFGATGETEAANFLWSMRQDSTNRTEVFWEQGSGGNVEEITESSPYPGRWVLMSLTRATDGLATILYTDGAQTASFNQATKASGGTSSEFICEEFMGLLGGFVVTATTQTPATVLAVAQQVGVA